MTRLIYKICPRGDWSRATEEGRYTGSPVDVADGFIHFSTASQARETAARHFAGQNDLVLVQIDTAHLPAEALKWEPSRGGALFPHLYAPMPVSAALRTDPLPWDGQVHRFPESLSDG